MKKIARKIKKLDNFQGEAWLYKIDPPAKEEPVLCDEVSESEYIVSSAVSTMFGSSETFLFLCDKDGNVLNWGELEGSFCGGMDNDKAVRDAGYEIISEVPSDETTVQVSES